MPNQFGVFSLADVLAKSDESNMNRLRMQQALHGMQGERSLADLYAQQQPMQDMINQETPANPDLPEGTPGVTRQVPNTDNNPLGRLQYQSKQLRDLSQKLAQQGQGNMAVQFGHQADAIDEKIINARMMMGQKQFSDIKTTEDGKLIGINKTTGQYEYVPMPSGAVASQPPVMADLGSGIVPLTRAAANNAARGGGIITKRQNIPEGITKAYTENRTNLTKVDDILKAINPSPTREDITYLSKRGIQHDPEAFGAKTLTPNIILNRTDPSGTSVRAIAADLGSMVIHDRSGAAVTVSEFPRLRPFIPATGDDTDTVRKKLIGFKRTYEQIQKEIESEYSPDRGYTPLQPSQMNTQRQAPQAAIDALRANPDLADQFKAKFGYLP